MNQRPASTLSERRTSTFKLIVELYKLSNNPPDSVKPSLINRCAKIDALVAQNNEKISVTSPGELTSIKTDIDISFPKIGGLASKDLNTIRAQFQNRISDVEAKLNELNKLEADLIKVKQENFKRVDQMKELLVQFAAGRLSEQELLEQLKKYESSTLSNKESIKTYLTKFNTIKHELNTLHADIYQRIPEQDARGLTKPVYVTEREEVDQTKRPS